MAYVLAVSLTAELIALYEDIEKMFNAQFIPMISYEGISRFIIFYFFGFNFLLFRYADKLKSERHLYMLYSNKDVSALGHPAPPPPFGSGGDDQWQKDPWKSLRFTF
jgi:hypothetical protein